MNRLMVLAFSLLGSTVVYADVLSLNHNGGLTSNAWADGDWYMRGLEVDSAGDPVGAVSTELMITLTNNAPFIDPVLSADMPDGDFIWFFRSRTSGFQVGDTGVEVFRFECSGGNAICDESNTGNVFLSDSLFVTYEDEIFKDRFAP